MTKLDLIKKISGKTGLDRNEVTVVVESLMSEVKGAVCKGEGVFLRGFGTFGKKKKAAKMGRNISKNTAILIPEHFAPFFKPAKIFYSQVKQKNEHR